jgi:hypothetical protein
MVAAWTGIMMAVAVVVGASTAWADPLAPPAGRVLLIIGQDRDAFHTYVREMGRVPAGSMCYTSIQDLQGLAAPADYGGGVQDASALLQYPDTVLQVGLWMVGALEPIVAGQYDANVDRLADWLTQTRRPIYLRVGYEFDFPQNNYAPEAYVAAYRYLVDRLRERGVRNVAYVWHSYAAHTDRPVMDWYPGDAYVDWVAASYWDPEQDAAVESLARLAQEHGKPLMIAEATPRVLGTRFGQHSWEGWFAPCLRIIKTYDVRALSYINWEWATIPMFKDLGWEDSRVHAYPELRALWEREVADPRYLHASPDLYAQLGFAEAPAQPSEAAR